MRKKILPVLLALTLGSLFVAFKTKERVGDDPKTKNEKILQKLGLILEREHYTPRNIDDSFSKQVLHRFVKGLDDDKTIFLQSDIDSFKKYDNRIDDEIHGDKLESFYAIKDAYTRRVNDASQYFTEILSKPFDFAKDEEIILDGEKVNYPKTEKEKKEVWYKRLKYLVLGKYVDLLEERKNDKNKKLTTTIADSTATSGKVMPEKFIYKADAILEREARDLVRKQIGRHFNALKENNTDDGLFSSFVKAITTEMDSGSDYFAPVDSHGGNEIITGKFYGLGVILKDVGSKIKIDILVTGRPGWRSGELELNDEIIKIGEGSAEPVDVTGYSLKDASKLIRGTELGSEVRLTIRKLDGRIKIVILKRGEIMGGDTFAKSAIIKGEHKIGYIFLPAFYLDFAKADGAKCSDDVAKEIVKLKAENVEGIVMDLRGNGGGSLPEVIKIASLFIQDGPVYQVRGRDEETPSVLGNLDKSVLYTGPLTVMVDEASAAVSEIFAAAIQDYKRGIIIGSTSTHGRGTVQSIIPLNPETENGALVQNAEDLGTVKLTFQKLYRINGGSTQLKGVTPDIVIPDRLEFYKTREKDNTTALGWDEIKKADYTPCVSLYNNQTVINTATAQVNASAVFNKIKTQVAWIDKQNAEQYPLSLIKYQKKQEQLKVANKELNRLCKLPKDLTVVNNQVDTTDFACDKDKIDRNKQWLNRLKGDVYIDETVKVMDNMINQANVGLKDSKIIK